MPTPPSAPINSPGKPSVRSLDDSLTGAEYRAQGYTHLGARCICGRSSYTPWGIFRGPMDVPLVDLSPRMQCKECGVKGPKLTAWAQGKVYVVPGTPYIED